MFELAPHEVNYFLSHCYTDRDVWIRKLAKAGPHTDDIQKQIAFLDVLIDKLEKA